ncbi:nucleoside monophosphate kinase [Patescibacteria group bacterium]|nr:nucleoside monophosphate kinase [Patescibacteria group bacterium]MBU1728236.1 nucleoside monophosphate kinase [Patescibacteria group bacterium]
MNSKAFLFFGRSGCGKGTQAKLLADFLRDKGRKVVYVETGGRFREFMKKESYSSQLTQNILHEGGLLPVFLPIWLWTNILVDNFSGEEDLILDGLCRRKEESMALDSAFDFYKIERPNIILMNVSREWSFDRMMKRKRPDDTPEKIQNRLDWFTKDVMPAIDYFREKPECNFIEVNGEQSIEDVHKDIIKALGL